VCPVSPRNQPSRTQEVVWGGIDPGNFGRPPLISVATSGGGGGGGGGGALPLDRFASGGAGGGAGVP